MIPVIVECFTCIHEHQEEWEFGACEKYCHNRNCHEFKCIYCKFYLMSNDKICEMENDDGSMNCFNGDSFELNTDLYVLKES